MAKNKTQEFKDFSISMRKKIGSGLTNAPVWLMQKAGKRIWGKKQKRTWKNIKMGKEFARAELDKGSQLLIRSGRHKHYKAVKGTIRGTKANKWIKSSKKIRAAKRNAKILGVKR
jgi:hypothetical protein